MVHVLHLCASLVVLVLYFAEVAIQELQDGVALAVVALEKENLTGVGVLAKLHLKGLGHSQDVEALIILVAYGLSNIRLYLVFRLPLLGSQLLNKIFNSRLLFIVGVLIEKQGRLHF